MSYSRNIAGPESVLTGLLDLADSIEVRFNDKQVNIEVTGPELHYENVWYYRCLGSPIASIVASIASDGIGKPVRIAEENYRKGKSINSRKSRR